MASAGGMGVGGGAKAGVSLLQTFRPSEKGVLCKHKDLSSNPGI